MKRVPLVIVAVAAAVFLAHGDQPVDAQNRMNFPMWLPTAGMWRWGSPFAV